MPKGIKGFQKGNKNWKGKKHKKESKEKISLTRKKLFKEKKLKIIGMTGKKHTGETKRKIGIKSKLKHIPCKKETRIKIGLANKNHIVTKETREKIKKARAKQIFPIKDTSIEIKIQNFLKQLGIEFFTHQYIKKIEHSYQCDIFIPSLNMIIECDGNYWHKYPVGNNIDHIRTKELTEKGFKVLRLWENKIRIMKLNDFKEILFKAY